MTAKRIAVLAAAGILFAAATGAVTRGQQSPLTPTPQSLAAKIPVNVKRAMLDSIIASNSPTADDKQGGFHEEGGMWVTTADGQIVAETAIPGKYAKPGVPAHLRANDPANPLPAERIAGVGGVWHVHPCGEIVTRRVLPEKDEGDRRIITTIVTTTYFGQPPSDGDIAAVQLPVNIEIGARSQVVYFYDRSGVTGTMPLEEFLAPLQLPPGAVCWSVEAGKPSTSN